MTVLLGKRSSLNYICALDVCYNLTDQHIGKRLNGGERLEANEDVAVIASIIVSLNNANESYERCSVLRLLFLEKRLGDDLEKLAR
jgi:hypothetical protein